MKISAPEIKKEDTKPTKITTATSTDHFQNKLLQQLKNINWLNTIGIFTLVLGIGFFVKYAIDQNWINEIGRVAIGILTGGILIGIAHKLSQKYHAFSSILMGGGFATFYVTITIAFREYEVFNQITAFVILIIITVLCVLLSIGYKRQELTIFGLIGGMLAPLLVSSGSGNHLVLFSYILLLNSGVLIVAYKKEWFIVNKFSYVLTILYFYTWVVSKYKVDYILSAAIFNILFFIQLGGFMVLRYLKTNIEKIQIRQLIFFSLLNIIILINAIKIFHNKTEVNYLGVYLILLALINVAFLVIIKKTTKFEVHSNLGYTLLGLIVGFVSLSIPMQLDGNYITVAWAVEMAVLYFIWNKTKVNLFRMGFFILSILTLISYIYSATLFNPVEIYEDLDPTPILPIIINKFTMTGIFFILSVYVIKRLAAKSEIDESETKGLKNIAMLSNTNIHQIMSVSFLALLYIVPILELRYQITVRIENLSPTAYMQTFKNVAIITFTLFYTFIFVLRYKQSFSKAYYQIIFAVTVILLLIYNIRISHLRSEIFMRDVYPKAYFLIHFIAIVVGMSLLIWLYKRQKQADKKNRIIYLIILFVSIVSTLSVELDNLSIWIINDVERYTSILSNVHSYGYPILWGLLAMVPMIVGIKQNDVDLRKLSLGSFALIIAKFYLYDVWNMTQGGKIISFVILGIILLVVSFMMERIKLLVKDQDQNNDTSSITKE
ncbi:DUF2339 domain-containing protein [Myroides albus]|uniref:DUF2339 domain-containing protein n=1 Tax=Myroides albus TaxID=2562892 RepID=UPI002159A50D|nr:DUF2339 domain-containing protein [Myroides albus]UVD81091.1 DUF2339 domain-containing protein [Myroides albus]